MNDSVAGKLVYTGKEMKRVNKFLLSGMGANELNKLFKLIEVEEGKND
jgi:hypothetical protein